MASGTLVLLFCLVCCPVHAESEEVARPWEEDGTFSMYGNAVIEPVLIHTFPTEGLPGRIFLEKNLRVYFEAGSHLHCYDLKRMRERWNTPGVLNSNCNLRTDTAGSMLAGDMATTGIHWDALKAYKNEAPPGRVIVVQGTDGNIIGIRKTDGKPLWDFRMPSTGNMVRLGPGATLLTRMPIHRNVVYALFRSTLHALNAKRGTHLWKLELAEGAPESLRVGTPLICGSTLCFGVLGVNISKKKVAWRLKDKLNAFVGDTLHDDGIVYFTANHHRNTLYAMEPLSGRKCWTFAPAKKNIPMGIMPPPAIWEDRILVAYYDKEAGGPSTLYCLDKKTGKSLWDRKVDGIVPRAPEVFGGVAYVYTWKKKIEIFNILTGEHLSSFQPRLRKGKQEKGPGPMVDVTGGEDIAYFVALPGMLLAAVQCETAHDAEGNQMGSESTKHNERLGLRVYGCARFNPATARAAFAHDPKKARFTTKAQYAYFLNNNLADDPRYFVDLLRHVDRSIAVKACNWLKSKYPADFAFLKAKTDAEKWKALKSWKNLINEKSNPEKK
jgi:outer membrane protein assembly factor BamB